MKNRKRFDFDFRKVCRTLRRMVRSGWAVCLRDGKKLRLRSPGNLTYYSPEEALFIFVRGQPIAVAPGSRRRVLKELEEVERFIAPALRQHPSTALSIAVSAVNWSRVVFHGLQPIYKSLKRRRALFTACGLDPKSA